VEKANAILPFLMAVVFRQRNRQQYPSDYRHFMGPDPSTTLADFIQAAFLRQSVFGSGDIAEAAVEARD
jgi:hypothetical protein